MNFNEIKIQLKPYNKYIIANYLKEKVQHKNTLIDYIVRKKIILDFTILDNIKMIMKESFIELVNERKQQLLANLDIITKCKFIDFGYFNKNTREGFQYDRQITNKNCSDIKVIDDLKLYIEVIIDEVEYNLKYSFRDHNFYSSKMYREETSKKIKF